MLIVNMCCCWRFPLLLPLLFVCRVPTARYVRPPIIVGDVSRAAGAMTVRWSAFAQSLTDRPLKGMLTGPV